jgi:hypothetical protein
MTEATMESHEGFKARVHMVTGIRYEEIPVGEPDDLLGGMIFCKRGMEYVVSFGYPDFQGEDGAPIWLPIPDNFRRVTCTCTIT